MDAKIALINTVTALVFGYVAFLGKWWIDCAAKDAIVWNSTEKLGFMIHLPLIGLATFFGVKVFIESKKVWHPNHSALKKEEFTALFPEWDGQQIDQEFVDLYLQNIAGGSYVHGRNVGSEYAVQLRIVGKIVHAKIKAGQKVLPNFKLLCIFVGLETVALVFCMCHRVWVG